MMPPAPRSTTLEMVVLLSVADQPSRLSGAARDGSAASAGPCCYKTILSSAAERRIHLDLRGAPRGVVSLDFSLRSE
jgi:hypothetical protein